MTKIAVGNLGTILGPRPEEPNRFRFILILKDGTPMIFFIDMAKETGAGLKATLEGALPHKALAVTYDDAVGPPYEAVGITVQGANSASAGAAKKKKEEKKE